MIIQLINVENEHVCVHVSKRRFFAPLPKPFMPMNREKLKVKCKPYTETSAHVCVQSSF